MLHYLAAIVASTGTPVATTSSCFFNPILPVVSACDPDDIAVYPEIIGNNFLGASRVVRYGLYYPRHAFTQGDLVIVYMAEYLESWRKASGLEISAEDMVEVPNIESPDWCFPEPKTIENLLYTGKQTCPDRPSLAFTEMPALNDPHRFRLRYACLALMRRAQNLYTMDHYTVLEREAILCGCRVFRVHGPKDFREQHDDPEPRVMRPQRDRALGDKFVSLIKKFFNL